LFIICIFSFVLLKVLATSLNPYIQCFYTVCWFNVGNCARACLWSSLYLIYETIHSRLISWDIEIYLSQTVFASEMSQRAPSQAGLLLWMYVLNKFLDTG